MSEFLKAQTWAASVQSAIAAMAAGLPVVVVDDEDRENEGDLIFAAELATPELLAFTLRHTSGYVCVALPAAECDRLCLPPMHRGLGDRFKTAYRLTVDLRGTGTGISARARARTIAALGSTGAEPQDFVRPGHVVPLQAQEGGVLVRPGHTEAAVDLARLAGLRPVGGLCEIVSLENPGEMARRPELIRFAAEHSLPIVSIADLVAYRRRTESQVSRVVETVLPTHASTFRVIGYRGLLDGAEHVALVADGPTAGGHEAPVYVHVECLAGDIFQSLDCGCAAELQKALDSLAFSGGVLVYVRDPYRTLACHIFDSVDAKARDRALGIAFSVIDDLGLAQAELVELRACS